MYCNIFLFIFLFFCFKAIAVTFVRFFLAPLKDVGKAFSEFIKALLEDLPITYYPIALVMVTVFLFMLLFMMFGYSIRLPFFLTIERSWQQAVTNGQMHQAISDGNQQILEQVHYIVIISFIFIFGFSSYSLTLHCTIPSFNDPKKNDF